ncbi:MAG: sel1 repeat family protein [Prevotella sp.]|nr:sel1 repeat family protein [Prevotella sp.]
MRHIKKIIAVCIMMMTASMSFAIDKDLIKEAAGIIKGTDDSHSVEWAVKTLTDAAVNDTCGYAMNVLGIACFNGIGMEKDTTKAVAWMEAAANAGFHVACHNLGEIYHQGRYGMKQDFRKAYSFYKRGADNDCVMCYYDEGYMLYKGLGCRQDYAKAAELFRKGVDRNHAPCLYMMGLCYRNGYGVERDEELAASYLGLASKTNYVPAILEQRRASPENSLETGTVLATNAVPEAMPEIEPFILSNEKLGGRYSGAIVTYDWSGEHAIATRDISMDATIRGDSLLATWVDGNETTNVKAVITDNGRLVFDNGTIRLKDRYHDNKMTAFSFIDADICLENQTFTGSLRLYSMRDKEPDRPMYILLQRDDADNVGTKEPSKAYAYPYPFTSTLTVAFDLPQNEPDVMLCLYDQYGINVCNYSLGTLSQGQHSFNISPEVMPGIYMIRIKAGTEQFKTIFTRKGGF